MPESGRHLPWETFFVEHYEPGRSADELARSAARVREIVSAMRNEGKEVRYVRSTIVPGDEAFLCVVEASSEELVREAYLRAGVEFERISIAISG